jgi:hypothetical protein
MLIFLWSLYRPTLCFYSGLLTGSTMSIHYSGLPSPMVTCFELRPARIEVDSWSNVTQTLDFIITSHTSKQSWNQSNQVILFKTCHRVVPYVRSGR